MQGSHGHHEHGETLPSAKHIVLPFDLHKNPKGFFERKNIDLLKQLFPSTLRVDFDEWVLVFVLETLPPKPWPLKVANVPCYLTTDPTDNGPTVPLVHRSRSRITLGDGLYLRDAEHLVDQVFDILREFFDQSPIQATEIQYWRSVIIIVLVSVEHAVLENVPKSVGGCPCFYLEESDMGRPAELPVLRGSQPDGNAFDTSEYEPLRPGVMVNSGEHPVEGCDFTTSSGVMVRDALGQTYMTIAAHGFPGYPFTNKVYHPSSRGKEIGEVIVESSHSDVALVKLNENVTFVNEPFENTILPGGPFTLRQFARAGDTRIGNNVYMDSPFLGFVEGTTGIHSFVRIPNDDPNNPQQMWIRGHWDYMGQGSSSQMAAGVCGSAIWDDNHRVHGFFRYAPQSGRFQDWCLTVAADHLIDRGYTLV